MAGLFVVFRRDSSATPLSRGSRSPRTVMALFAGLPGSPLEIFLFPSLPRLSVVSSVAGCGKVVDDVVSR